MLALVVPFPTVAMDESEADLARRIRGSSQEEGREAERALCERFAPRIRLYGLRHLGDEASAADLVQVVLVRVIQALRAGTVETPERLGAFVLGTCRYATWDMRRSDLRQRAIEAAATTLHTQVAPPDASAADFMRMFRCLQRLPERDGLVVRMSFMEERDAEDIGRRTGLTPGNVRVVRHRALARLHECIEKGDAA